VAKPCEEALSHAGLEIGDVDTLIATSETHLGFPALAARLHARLLARADCAALDVGGGCLGLVNALHVAKSLLLSGATACVLVATSDVHSHVLTPPKVKGQFGGLFGDGASAFVLQPGSDGRSHDRYFLGEFLFGCQPAYATAIQISLDTHQSYHLRFDGEALARAAVEQLEQTIEDLELRSGVKRDAAAAFATHQPNPRLVDLLARRLGVPSEKFPEVARVNGNLGSSTCGVALCRALAKRAENENIPRAPIFLASLGPGLLWGGAVFH
jgi:3-oxoacyl-[acyl-carrier-protein] synthase-3